LRARAGGGFRGPSRDGRSGGGGFARDARPQGRAEWGSRPSRPAENGAPSETSTESGASARPERERPARARPERPRYDITCAECGTPAQVPFKPLEGRQVFCQPCYRARKGAGAPPDSSALESDNGIVE
jgi:CxxC-x17-CxxC domain-containing protein